MSEIEDDIARVARLRGIDPDSVIQAARQDEADATAARERKVGSRRQQVVEMLKHRWDDKRGDYRYFDDLPPLSRHFIRENKYEICARHYEYALHVFEGDEEALAIAASRALCTSWPVPPSMPVRSRHRPRLPNRRFWSREAFC